MSKKILILALLVLFTAPVFAQKIHRSEISVSYGCVPVTDWIDAYTDFFSGLPSGSHPGPSGWGAVTVGYDFRLLGALRLGAQVVYSSNDQKIASTGTKVENRYWAVMPNVRWGWMNLRIVSFYSRLGVGLAFSKSEGGGHSDTATQLAFQFSPLGVEVGGRLAAYAEAGLGVSGSFLLGARYRF